MVKSFIITTISIIFTESLMSASLEKIVIRDKNISYIYEESHQLPIVSLQLVFTGLRDISENNLSGIGNFTASLLNEGTTISGDENFSEKLDERAIQLSASANDGSLSIHLDVLKENLNPAIDLLAELIKYPNFQENPFNRVRNQILSDILQKESDFDYLANIGLNALYLMELHYQNQKLELLKILKKYR